MSAWSLLESVEMTPLALTAKATTHVLVTLATNHPTDLTTTALVTPLPSQINSFTYKLNTYGATTYRALNYWEGGGLG